MNKIAKFFSALRRNPNSKSAKTRAERRKLLTVGVVTCCKCGASKKTLYKRRLDKKEQYICFDCYSKTPEFQEELAAKRGF